MEVKLENATMIYRNGLHPGLIWSGEQANEHYHSTMKLHCVHSGKYGLLKALMKKDFLSLKWNHQRFFYYLDWENQDKFYEMNLSAQLIGEIHNAIYDAQHLTVILEEIKQRGVCIADDKSGEVQADQLHEILINQLYMTSNAKWTPRMYEILNNYLISNGHQRHTFNLKRDKVLPQISELFQEAFTKDFLERRCNTLGFFFQIKLS